MSIFDFAKTTLSKAIGGQNYNLLFSIGSPEYFQDSNSIWTLHEGTKKDDGKEVSVFIFDFKKHPNKASAAKNALKRAKTIRYPDVLKFLDGVETDSQIIIGTEYVKPLRSLLDQKIDSNLIKLGLFKISSTLKFLTEDCSLVHGLVNPENIFVTKSGEWKLGGFEAISSIKDGHPYFLTSGLLRNQSPPEFNSQDPWELVQRLPLYSTDAWSFGCLIHTVFNQGKNVDLSNRGNIPSSLYRYAKEFLSACDKRISFSEFLKNSSLKGGFFNDEFIASSQFLENFAIKDKSEKEQYLIDIEAIVDKFPTEFCKFKILPELINCLEFGGAGAKALKPIITIGSKFEFNEFQILLAPTLVKLFASQDRLLRLALCEKMPLYVDKISEKAANDNIYPNLSAGFADNTPIIREQTLKAISILAPKLSSKTINDSLLRHLAKLQTDPEAGIRTNTTICLVKLVKYFDEGIKAKVLLQAFLRAIKDPFPPARKAGLMGLAATSSSFPPEDLARKLLPSICPMLIDPEKAIREQAFQTLDIFKGIVAEYASKIPDKQLEQSKEEKIPPNDSGWAASVGGWALNSIASTLKKDSAQELDASKKQIPETVKPPLHKEKSNGFPETVKPPVHKEKSNGFPATVQMKDKIPTPQPIPVENNRNPLLYQPAAFEVNEGNDWGDDDWGNDDGWGDSAGIEDWPDQQNSKTIKQQENINSSVNNKLERERQRERRRAEREARKGLN